MSLVAYLLALTVPKPAWNLILDQSPSAVEKRIGKPTQSRLESYDIYDPRWITWADQRTRSGAVVGHILAIIWRYNDNALHDKNLWAGRVPRHAQSKGNWVAYVGGPLRAFEKLAERSFSQDTANSMGVPWWTKHYRVKNIGGVEVEGYDLGPSKPVITRLLVYFGPKWTLEKALKAMKIDAKAWKTMGPQVDPNSLAHLRYPLGKGAFRENEYSLGEGETLKVYYAGPVGKETAQQFTLYSDKLTGVLQGAAWFGYTIRPKDVNTIEGTESAWDRLFQTAVFVPKPTKQLTIGNWTFDVNDPD